MKKFKFILIFQVFVCISLLIQSESFAYEEECFDQEFLDNCEYSGGTLTTPCTPYPGSPYCIIQYQVCILGKQIRILNYSWSGTCSCMDVEAAILRSVLGDAERFGITSPGCFLDFKVQLMGCFIERDISNGTIGQGKELSQCEPFDAEQCCGVGYQVCYKWSCPTGQNCNLIIESFEPITASFPITDCPDGCNSQCDRWLISFTLPVEKGSLSNGKDELKENVNVLVKEDILEIIIDQENNEKVNVQVNVFDIMGKELNLSMKEVSMNKLILGLQTVPKGHYTVIIRIQDKVYVKNFIKY